MTQSLIDLAFFTINKWKTLFEKKIFLRKRCLKIATEARRNFKRVCFTNNAFFPIQAYVYAFKIHIDIPSSLYDRLYD
jgi:hypothetical protein